MLSAILWGLVQGLTEFLPVSSSGHLVIVPAFLAAAGADLAEPSLAFSAVLHLGTLGAVLVYFRSDIARLFRFRTDAEARRLLMLLGIGTVPMLAGFPLQPFLESVQSDPTLVSLALIGTSAILFVGSRYMDGRREVEDARVPDAVVVGLAQAVALLPGISRSGSTIVAATVRGLSPTQAARYSFLLGVPAIAGAGLKSLFEMPEGAGVAGPMWVGVGVAAVSGYLAISLLLAVLRRTGFLPFAIYAFIAGVAGLFLV